MVFRFVVLQMRMYSPLFGLQTCVLLPEASSTTCLEQQRLWRNCAYAQARLAFAGHLYDKYLFSCAGSYKVVSKLA